MSRPLHRALRAITAIVLGLVVVLGFTAAARLTPVGVATVLLRAAEPSDVAPADDHEPGSTQLERFAQSPRIGLGRAARAPHAHVVTERALSARLGVHELRRRVQGDPASPIGAAQAPSPARARAQLMVYLN